MKRREFIAGLGSAAAWPLVARAQQPAVPVIGWLSPVPGSMERVLPAFSQGLAETGYVVGRNVTIDASRDNVGQKAALAADLAALAAELVRRRPTMIFAQGINSALAAKAATQAIPVVFGMLDDPVQVGVVASLSHPSGDLTGVTSLGRELAGKRLEILHKLVPVAHTIALLTRRVDGPEPIAMQSAAGALGIRLLSLSAANKSEVAEAFATLIEQHAGALVLSSNANFPATIDQILLLALRHAVPTLFFARDEVARGGLASYGTARSELFRQAGIYTGRILKGEKPADLPVIQPTRFELVINLKTAKALGLTIPETLLATADEIIQ